MNDQKLHKIDAPTSENNLKTNTKQFTRTSMQDPDTVLQHYTSPFTRHC